MERYRKILKKRAAFSGAAAIVCLVMIYFTMSGTFMVHTSNNHFKDYIMGFQSGLLMGMAACAVVYLVKVMSAVRDDMKLRKFYNRENDERKKFIKDKCGIREVLPFSIAIIFVGIIGGYFSETVFITLVICGSAQILCCDFLKLYYMKKY